MQLGEAFHEESLERPALLLTYDERVKAFVLVAVALTAVTAAKAAVPTPEAVKTGFAVPSRNMVCYAGSYPGGNVLACTVFSEASARGQKIWSMQTRGRVSVGFLQSNAATELPLLRYGRSWTWHGIRCTSRRTGLACKNQSGHGFVLNRLSQRVF
jgi:uncharacterized protein DUF6636